MNQQLELPAARQAGKHAAQLATERAEHEAPGFGERARALILERLGQGPASGEDCTDYCASKGLQFADGRALGSIYSSLRRAGLIEPAGFCARRRGHGTAGGIVWRLA